jgi:SAM-dependent methyltransferase
MIDNIRIHAGRVLVLDIYRELINEYLVQRGKPIRVAVVSGGSNEPELLALSELKLPHIPTFFGLGAEVQLDLNELNRSMVSHLNKFDLVLCCQVLEHVYNVQNALKNLSSLVSQNGFIWINVPASNMKHGSPEYFSAGYQPELIERLLSPMKIKVIKCGDVGTKRLYFMTHKQQYWPSFLEHRIPFLRGIHGRRWTMPIKFAKYFPRNMQAQSWSSKKMFGTAFSTETFYFGRKSTTSLE